MKIVDKDGNEIKDGDLTLVEDDGITKKPFDAIGFVRNARTAGSQAKVLRTELKTAQDALKAYELEDGNMLDPELAAAAIKRAEKYKGDKESVEAQLQAVKEAYEQKMSDTIAPLNETIIALKQERIKAALLSSKDLQGTIFFALGERHLMTEFGGLVDDDGNPLDRAGKPIMSDADPSKPATVAEAAPLWIATHPDGKDKIMLDAFSGGAGGSGGKGGVNNTGKAGYAGIVADAKK